MYSLSLKYFEHNETGSSHWKLDQGDVAEEGLNLSIAECITVMMLFNVFLIHVSSS